MTRTEELDSFERDQFRPDHWDGFIGQARLKAQLETHIAASTAQGVMPNHMLFCGPPGFGKTTLARIIAARLNKPVEVITMPAPFRELLQLLVVSDFQGVLLLDEFHRLTPKQQEDYLTVIESNVLEIDGEKFPFENVTIVVATTERKKILDTIVDRFPLKPTIDPYAPDEMGRIVKQMAAMVDVELDVDTATDLGRACAGTPRRARDIALAARDLVFTGTEPTAEAVLHYLRLDADGLTELQLEYLRTLKKLGGEAGLKPLANMLGETPQAVESLERLLVDLGLITFGGKGRKLRSTAYLKIRDAA